MTGLSRYDPRWEQARANGDESRVYEDDGVLIATDFEGGNGRDIRLLGPDHYAVTLELEPGTHRFSGRSYYYCFGIQNKRANRRTVRVRVEARPGGGDQDFGGIKHAVIRRGGAWSQLDPDAVQRLDGMRESLEVDLPLPGSEEADSVIFVMDFHWWPYTEMVAWLGTLGDKARVREIGRSFQDRPIYAVEMGREGAPCIVNAQTPQPSEMGHLACKAMIDFLCSDDPEAAQILQSFRVCFVPMTNPDGSVLGYGVSDAQGRFTGFEGHLAANDDPDTPPEMVTLWSYLKEQKPWLYWDWHSNNWHTRPGHMLIRYRHELIEDAALRRLWDDLEDRLLTLPNTYHENWTSHTEGPYQVILGFQAVTRLGIISCMIKHHDKYPLEQSQEHAIACLKIAAAEYAKAMS